MAHRVQLQNPIYNLVTIYTRIIVPSICLSVNPSIDPYRLLPENQP
jgi:hypothetical protein